MTVKKYSFFEEYDFIGEFFTNPNDNSDRFAGTLKHSPVEGLTLEYCISDDKSPQICDRLYGILNNGEQCTLIGPFDLQTGARFMSRGPFIRTGVAAVRFAVFGVFINDTTSPIHCDFTFNGMQEFIYPQGFKRKLKFETKPLISVSGTDWKIDVINKATFSHVGSDLANLLYTSNEDALEEIRRSLTSLVSETPISDLILRQSLEFFFRYTPSISQTPEILFDNVFNITSIFSMLLSNPTFPDEIGIKLGGETGVSYPLLYTLHIDKRTIELAKQEFTNHHLPLKWSELDMGGILGKWLEIYNNYKTLSSVYLYETNVRTINQTYGNIILYATMLEFINIEINKGVGDKYEAPIACYACPELSQYIREFFRRYNDRGVGVNISYLRNDIAHVGRPSRLIHKLELHDFALIEMYLKLIVTSSLFSKLGIKQSLLFAYQKRHTLTN
ncbi:hypothetical protein ACMSZN_003138 [Cronobacter dublinensis]